MLFDEKLLLIKTFCEPTTNKYQTEISTNEGS